MVHFVALLEPAQDCDGVVHRRLADEDLLEPSLESGVLFDVLAVLIQRGRTDQAQFAAREQWLDHVARVHRTFARPGAHDGVQLVDETDHFALGVLDLLEDGLEALFELAAILRSRHHGREVEGDQSAIAQGLGHVAFDDALGQTLDDGGLAHARFADQNGVVLRSTREHLDDATNLVVAADHRVELARPREGGEVPTVLFE